MHIYPAIDLMNSSCVRLTKGDFNDPIVYEADPIKQVKEFAKAGAKYLHLVDLDGAKASKIMQLPLITEIIKAAGDIKVQVGGGVRSDLDIRHLLDAGADRVIVGSLAAKNPDMMTEWLEKYGGDKLVVALDVRLNSGGLPEVLTSGWQEGSAQSLWNLLEVYKNTPLKTMLCTDIEHDGVLDGTNVDLYSKIRQIWSTLEVIASGGVASAQCIEDLNKHGIHSAIIGKAIYEDKIDLAEIITKYESD